MDFSTDWLTNFLMPGKDGRATGLISSLINITLSQDVPFHQPKQLQCLHHGVTFMPLCAPILSPQPHKGDDLR